MLKLGAKLPRRTVRKGYMNDERVWGLLLIDGDISDRKVQKDFN